jgi:probable HAF family extracellular repeat protein
VYTQTNGINDRGDIVGFYVDADGVAHGFLMSKKK